MSKRLFSILSRIVISVALLFFLFQHADLDLKKLWDIIRASDIFFLVIAAILTLLTHILCIFRWGILLRDIGIILSWLRIVISFSGGLFFNLFLPSTIGGDVLRTADLSASTNRPREILATVFLDRLSGYVGLVIVALFASFLGHSFLQTRVVIFSVGLITLTLVLILLVLFNNAIYLRINSWLAVAKIEKGATRFKQSLDRLRNYLKELHEEIYLFRNKRASIITNVFLSILIQLLGPLTCYFVALSLGVRITPLVFFIFLPIISAITLLPISIGGLGLRDASTVFFFSQVGLAKELALSISLVNFFLLVFYSAIGGVIYVSTVHHRRI